MRLGNNRLEVTRVSKAYATKVLDEVSFDLAAGEIHALIGANGAGKSTLSRIIAGLIPATSGQMELDGKVYAPKNKADAERAGVQIVQQELNLIGSLTIAENLFFNRLPHRFGFIDRRRLHELAKQAMQTVGLGEISLDMQTESLGVGVRQLIEIASALSRDCRVLILDEPTAALTNQEADLLFERLRQMRTNGISMIYISHRLDEIRKLCDRLTVLRDGKFVCTAKVAETPTAQMIAMMSGDSKKPRADTEPAADLNTPATFVPSRRISNDNDNDNDVALRVSKLCRGPLVRDVSFELKRGQRLGITGLNGSGRSELLRAIFGADQAESGEVQIANSTGRRFSHPQQAVRAGVALVTEDRKLDGLLLPLPIMSNVTIASLSRFATIGFISRLGEHTTTADLVGKVAAKCDSIEQPVDQLSGGNQQKVVLAKWLLRDPDVLLLDEPTRGIDVDARQRIHGLIRELAARGKGVVIVSSDLDELLEHCDSIAVMSAGKMVATFNRDQFSLSDIMAASFSQYHVQGAPQS